MPTLILVSNIVENMNSPLIDCYPSDDSDYSCWPD